MTKWIDPIKQIHESLAKPHPGYFAIPGAGCIKWENCRERFNNNIFTSDLLGFFFSHEIGECENIAAFIDKTEDILGVPKSSFSKVNRPYALWVSPSDFWKKCEVKRSLFTILLRAGRKYSLSIDNYEDALFSHEYISLTKNATKRFLFGFTEYVPASYNPKGWVSIFSGKKVEEVKKRLVSPEGNNFFMVDSAALWT